MQLHNSVSLSFSCQQFIRLPVLPQTGDEKVRNGEQKYDFPSDNRTKCIGTVHQRVLCSPVLFIANAATCVSGECCVVVVVIASNKISLCTLKGDGVHDRWRFEVSDRSIRVFL